MDFLAKYLKLSNHDNVRHVASCLTLNRQKEENLNGNGCPPNLVITCVTQILPRSSKPENDNERN